MISDEIRELCDETDIGGNACDELRELARRIDLEMVEYERLKKENAELKKILAYWQNARLDMLARAKKLAGIEEEVRNGD